MTITLNRTDLDYLLRQVTINYLAPDPNNPGQIIAAPFNYSQLANAVDPSGLREVSGANNNLVGGFWDANTQTWVSGPNTTWGQANQPFLNQSPAQSVESAPDYNGITSAYNTPGSGVTDTDPRIISNLVATMFTTGPNANPAAIDAATNSDPLAQNYDPIIGFVANAGVLGGGRYNGWFVAFGQFFDHGLDFVLRDPDPSATVTINLSPNDPLYDADGADNISGNFDDVTSIKVRRADVANASDAGGDGIFGTTDDNGYSAGADNIQGTADDTYAKAKYINNTGLLIDQSQTYGSHQSVNALIREYDVSGRPTGRVVSGNTAVLDNLDTADDVNAVGLATWADIKTNAARIGLILTDDDIHNAPVLRVDPAGKLLFTPGTNDWTLATAWNAFNGAVGPYSAALQDPTDPFLRDASGNVQFTGQNLLIDFNPGQSLDSHIITGDGRANENIGLTAVHHVFHEEHNALVENIKNSILATSDAVFIAQWQTAPDVWDGEKLYQAARLITESEYNHIAIDQYVGTLYGALPEFVSYSSDINMGISLEFSQAVFRLGHSMLTETVNVIDPNTGENLKLLDMFLNPTLYQDIGPTLLAQGLTTTLGNEVDEFVTPALQQTLLGQPLDLATINIARGRDVGLPTWNEFRQQVYDQLIQNTNNTNGSALAPYTNWADIGVHLKNEGTLVNFIAAYARANESSLDGLFGTVNDGDHDLTDAIIKARTDYANGAVTIDVLRSAAQALYDAYLDAGDPGHAEAVEFMRGTPTYNSGTGQWTFEGADQGFWDIDLWIGGLAERPLFDGPLGTTFSYVILDFAQRQQDGDRFYYLFRTPMGTHLGNEIIENQFGNLVMDHTGLDHLNGEIFIWANATFKLTETPDYFNAAEHIITDVDGSDMVASDGHLIIAGLGGDDYLAGGLGDDTIYGDDGNDQLYGSQGNDHLFGGAGNDYIFDDENDDFITGGAGNDRIFAGPGAIDTVFGDEGDDELHGGDGIDEVLGGTGDDMIYGDGDTDVLFGEEGNDYLEGGDSVDEMQGQEGNDWMRGGVGDDHLMGGDGNDLLEGGVGPTANDGDRMLGQGVLDFALTNPPDLGLDVASYEDVDIAITANLDTSNENGTGGLLDTYAGIEGLVGTRFDDDLTGAGPDTTSTNGFDNLLVGGGGNDILTGLGGDDIIVGDAVATRSDFTVDKGYTGTIANWKGTGDDRPTYGTDLGHFLGETGAAGIADVAVFSGNYANGAGYSIEAITYGGYDAIRITDLDASNGDDGVDILIDVEKARFLDRDVNLVNAAPVLQLHAFDTGNFRDQFGSASYSNSNGSLAWGTSWAESGDVTTGNVVTGGQIRISNGSLRIGDNDNDTGLGGATIQRSLNLAGVTSATLSYAYDENSFDSGEIVTVSFAADGTNFTTIQTINSASGSGSTRVALTGPFTANAMLRFVVSGTNNNSSNDIVSIDNINIDVAKPAVAPTTNYSTSFTEDGSAVAIAAGPSITDDGTQIMSAKIVLTNAQAGDSLSANDIAGDGITSTTDNSVAGQITINLSGAASLAAYQDAIQAVTFTNISQAPSTQPRTLQVTVNDGLANSNVATSTIHVVSVNDAPSAANDRLITNFANANFAVPEWAFLANDTDADSTTLDITSVSGASGLSNLSLATTPGSITMADTGSAGGSFNYTASDGQATDLASVNVVRDTSGNIDGGFLGNLGDNIFVGDGSNSTFVGGLGNDIIFAGAGNDTINWNVNSIIIEIPDGHDFIDGGTNTVTGDRFVVNGGNSAETFRVYALADALAAGMTGFNPNTEIVITRNGTNNDSVIAELDNIEEITINTGGGNDTVLAIGNFSPTSLNFNTITVNDSGGSDTVDISGLTSEHRVVLHSSSGNDRVIGGLGNDLLDGGAGVDTAVFSGQVTGYGFSLSGSKIVVSDSVATRDGIDSLICIEKVQFDAQTFAMRVGTNGKNTLNGTQGADLLLGFGGNDELDGNGGVDVFVGGAGSDDFNFNDNDMGVGTLRDIIMDFAGGGGNEDIDLSAIDANTGVSGGGENGQAFHFVGTESFSAAAQVRYGEVDTDDVVGVDSTLIQGNVNADLAADFEILLKNYTSGFTAGDFNL